MQPEPYPLAPLQRGMLFHALAAPESTMYIEQYQLSLAGVVNLAAFRAAWQTAMARHPALRTQFDWAQVDRPCQVPRAAVPLPLEVADWRDQPAAEHAVRLRQIETAERERGFDLSKAPLFRLWLVRLADQQWQLLWTHHHLILDGWSVGLVLHEVATIYAAEDRGEPSDLASPPRFCDFVAWAGQQDLAQARQHWTRALAGFTEPTELGIVRSVGPAETRPERVGHRLPSGLAQRLDRFAGEQRLSIDTLLTAAWAVVLGWYSGTDDVVFGVTTSGRGGALSSVDRMVGLLITTLPARVQLDWDQPVVPWLRQLQQQRDQAGELERTPLDEVQACSEVPGGRRLFDSILVIEDFPFDVSTLVRLGEVAVTGSVGVQQTNYPITLVAHPRQQRVEALFDATRVDAWLVRGLLGHLEAVLRGLAGTSLLGEVELLRPAERAELLNRGAPERLVPPAVNPAEDGPSRDGGPVPARFAARAQAQPAAVAVSYGDEQVSYEQLLVGVARLAHRLRGLGVGPGVLVGICAPRGVDLVVAVLAVACAGGGYVPVDQRNPPARVRAILADAAVAVLLTHDETASQLGPVAAATICLDDPQEQLRLAALPDAVPTLDAGLHDVAYVIYTSGSTGSPRAWW